jgi:hypothetical protein
VNKVDAEGAAVMLDGDPVWDQHSGGEGHSGREWRDGDGTLAEAFYAALPDSAKLYLT